MDEAKQLVRAVARAFYTDDTVAVLEALLREPFLKDDDMSGPAHLQLPPKLTRRILSALIAERLVEKVELNCLSVGGKWGPQWHYYIDYRSFVNVVSLRAHMLQRRVQQEAAQVATREFECPQCGNLFRSTDVHRLLKANGGLCCSVCCARGSHLQCQPLETPDLVEVSITAQQARMQSLAHKTHAQMGLKYGSFSVIELLNRCRALDLPHNNPAVPSAGAAAAAGAAGGGGVQAGGGFGNGGSNSQRYTAVGARTVDETIAVKVVGRRRRAAPAAGDNAGDNVGEGEAADGDERPRKVPKADPNKAQPHFLEKSSVTGEASAAAVADSPAAPAAGAAAAAAAAEDLGSGSDGERGGPEEADSEWEDEEVADGSVDLDATVAVAGEAVRVRDVTEEMIERMSKEEFAAFFALAG